MENFFCSVTYRGDSLMEVTRIIDTVLSPAQEELDCRLIAKQVRDTLSGSVFAAYLYEFAGSVPWAQVHGCFKSRMPEEGVNRLFITLSRDPVLWRNNDQYFLSLHYYYKEMARRLIRKTTRSRRPRPMLRANPMRIGNSRSLVPRSNLLGGQKSLLQRPPTGRVFHPSVFRGINNANVMNRREFDMENPGNPRVTMLESGPLRAAPELPPTLLPGSGTAQKPRRPLQNALAGLSPLLNESLGRHYEAAQGDPIGVARNIGLFDIAKDIGQGVSMLFDKQKRQNESRDWAKNTLSHMVQVPFKLFGL